MALSANEQYMLELINRARLDPLGEAARHGIDLNQGLTAGRLHNDPRGVLAADSILELAATGHSLWMLDADVFSHTGINNSTPTQRATGIGHTGNNVNENIAWRGTTGRLDLEATIGQQHSDLFLSAGHRLNILSDNFREIGIAQEYGQFSVNGTAYNASMVTQNFSSHTGIYYVTGVVYSDTDQNRFYSIGEGQGDAQIGIGANSVMSSLAGGYALQATTGSTVLVEGSVGAMAFSVNVGINGVNAKLDIVDGKIFYASADIELVTGILRAKLLGRVELDAIGNAQSNVLEGNIVSNTLDGAAGNDVLWGLGGFDKLFGGLGNDRLSGGNGPDALRGGKGHDVLLGDKGKDLLSGDEGNDTLTGGSQEDTFVFARFAGQDVITDFSLQDFLRFDDAIWGGQQIANAAQLIEAHASLQGGVVVIALGVGGNQVTLSGIASLDGLVDRIVLF